MILKLSILLLLAPSMFAGVVGPGAPEGSTKPPKKNQTSDDQGHGMGRGVVGPGAPETTEEPEESTTRRAMVGTILVTRPRPTVRTLPSGAEGDLVFEEGTIGKGVVGSGAPEGSTKPPKKNQTSDDQGYGMGRGVVGPGAPETTEEPEEPTTRRNRFPSLAPPVTGEQDLPTRPPSGGDPSIPQSPADETFPHVPAGQGVGIVGPGAPEGSTKPPKKNQTSDDQGHGHRFARGVVGPGAPETTEAPEEPTTRRAMVGTILVTRPRPTVRTLPSVAEGDLVFEEDTIGRGVVGPGAPETTEEPEESTTRRSQFPSLAPPVTGEQDLPTRPPPGGDPTMPFVANFGFLKRGQRLARGVVGSDSTEDPNCSTHSVDPNLLDNQDLGPGGAIEEEAGTTTRATGVDQTTLDPSTSPPPVTSSDSASESPISSTPIPCSDAMCSVQQVLQQVLTQLLAFLENIFGSLLTALGIDLNNVNVV